MIEFAGVPYWDIAKAAVIPAALYFSGIWIMTHLEAKRIGLLGLPKEELPNKKEVFKKRILAASDYCDCIFPFRRLQY